MASSSPPFPKQARRWDPLVKLTHWGIAIAVATNALFTEEGSGWHIWVGYSLAALLALRLLWGFVGPPEARYSAFPPSPRAALDHIAEIRVGEHTYHRSHNPLGALMVYALWACLAVIVVSGITMGGPPPADPRIEVEAHDHVAGNDRKHEELGERGDDDGERGEDHDDGVAKEVHEIAVNLLYVLIALHLAGVVFETRRSGKDILIAMLPGKGRG